MGKMMAYSLMTVFLIEVGMYFFTGSSYVHTAIYNALINPSSLTSSVFYLAVLAIIATAALAVVTPTFLYQTNQWAIFAIGCALLITYVMSIAQFFSLINNTLLGIGGGVAAYGGLLATMITAPLIIVYITAMVEWTRFNQ